MTTFVKQLRAEIAATEAELEELPQMRKLLAEGDKQKRWSLPEAAAASAPAPAPAAAAPAPAPAPASSEPARVSASSSVPAADQAPEAKRAMPDTVDLNHREPGIVDYVEKNPGTTPDAIAFGMGDVSETARNDMLSKVSSLERRGFLMKNTHGRYWITPARTQAA